MIRKGSVEIKKIRHGKVAVGKVRHGKKLVYQSSNPFYIVENFVCKTALTWTVTSVSNIEKFAVGNTIVWHVGEQYPEVFATLKDEKQNGSITARSAAIDTKGNKTLQCIYDSSSAGTTVIVNGKSYSSGFTMDISNLSSITITVECRAHGYNYAFFEPGILRLY